MDTDDRSVVPRELPKHTQEARNAIFASGFAGAQPFVDQLLQNNPESEDLQALSTLILLWTGKMEEAWSYAQNRIKLNASAPIQGVASEIASYMALTEDSHRLIEAAISIDPDHFLVLRAKANLANIEGDYENSSETFHRSLSLYPQDPDAYASLILASSKNNAEVQEQMLAKAPDWFVGTAQYHNRRGMVALQRRSLEEAVSELRQAVATCPTGASFWANFSLALKAAANFDEAERAANYALELNPRNPLAMSTLATVMRHRGNLKASKEWADRAENAVPHLKSGAGLKKANDLIRKGDLAGAIRELRSATTVAGPHIARIARRLLISHLILDQQDKEARAELTKARAAGDNDSFLDVLEFRLLVRERQEPQAYELLQDLFNRTPIPSEIYPEAIRYYSATGAGDKVDFVYAILLRDLPGLPAMLADSITALASTGRNDQARQLQSLGLRRYPEDQALRLLDVQFMAEGGNPAGARRALSQMPSSSRPTLTMAFNVAKGRLRRKLRSLFRKDHQ